MESWNHKDRNEHEVPKYLAKRQNNEMSTLQWYDNFSTSLQSFGKLEEVDIPSLRAYLAFGTLCNR